MVCYPMNWTVCFDTPTGWVDFIRSKKRLWGYLKLYLLQYPKSWGVSVYLNLRLWKIILSTPWWWTLRVSRCTPTCNRDSNWVEATVETGLPWDWASHVSAGSGRSRIPRIGSNSNFAHLVPYPNYWWFTSGLNNSCWRCQIMVQHQYFVVQSNALCISFKTPERSVKQSKLAFWTWNTSMICFFHHFRILVAKFSTLIAAEAMSASFHLMVPLLARETKRGSWQLWWYTWFCKY